MLVTQFIHIGDAKRGKTRVNESWVVLVLPLIGWQSAVSILSQSRGIVGALALVLRYFVWKRQSTYYAPPTLSWRKLKTEVSLWKRFQMLTVHTTRTEFTRTQQSTVILGLCLSKTRSGNHVIIVTSSFLKSSDFKMFSFHRKCIVGVFKFLPFEERFRKALFSWRISVDGRPNRRNKTACSNFSSIVWKWPYTCMHAL